MVTGKRDELRLFLLTRRAPARKEVHDHPTAFEAGHLEALAGDRRHRTVRRGRDPGRWLIHERRARLLGCVSARREYCDETRNDEQDAPRHPPGGMPTPAWLWRQGGIRSGHCRCRAHGTGAPPGSSTCSSKRSSGVSASTSSCSGADPVVSGGRDVMTPSRRLRRTGTTASAEPATKTPPPIHSQMTSGWMVTPMVTGPPLVRGSVSIVR